MSEPARSNLPPRRRSGENLINQRHGLVVAAPHVTVIGAGIVGATIAYYLSRTDAKVRLIDARAGVARGVSGRSFGWVNYVTADPEAGAEIYRQRRSAFDHYRQLNKCLTGRLFGPPQGSLVWRSSASETERLVDAHVAHGSPTRIVSRAECANLVPVLAEPPKRAAYSPNDFALNVDDASELLVRCAKDAGVEVILGQPVEGIQAKAGNVAAVRSAGEWLATDIIVVAAGTASQQLLSDFEPSLGIDESPSVLIKIAAEGEMLGRILSGPDLEVRSRDENCLLVASSAPDDRSDVAKHDLGKRKLAEVNRMLSGVRNARVTSVDIGLRPITGNDRPLVGRLAAMRNLFVAVAHPGVILAPAIGKTIAEQVFERPVSTELGDRLIGS